MVVLNMYIVMQTWRLYFVVYPHVHAVREMILSKLNSKLVRMAAPGLEVTALCCSAPVVCSKALVVFLNLFIYNNLIADIRLI